MILAPAEGTTVNEMRFKTEKAPAHLVLCPPDYFTVSYRINPWMNPDAWARDTARLAAKAKREWSQLISTLTSLGARLELVPPRPGVPDMVFTANAAVVLDGKALLAHFRYPERQKEEPYLEAFFLALKRRGVLRDVAKVPETVTQEGAGDCLWDPARGLFWTGHGPRSSPQAAAVISHYFGVPVEPLELVDGRFYHLDTCLSPLSGGEVIYYPPAFSAASRTRLIERVGEDRLIEATPDDACALAVNAINIGTDLVMAACSTALERRLAARGYRVHRVPLTAFAKSGGAAFCLSLRLDHVSVSHLAEAAM